ncbi:MAG: DUF4080 domain-containing protein, partial [Bacilli bacterium]|nr:DUF4080 domain-containing protein [Bacilli bacterium]
FQFEIVGDLLEEDTINLLKTIRPGQIRFEIGVQSTNEIVTKAVRRKQNFSKLKANVLNIKEQITIHLDLIAGLPYEDKDSFINTFNETFLIFPHELQLGFLKELQGTEISKRKDIHNYQFSPFPPYEIESNLYLSKDDLEEIKTVEATLNKYYNTNNFPKTMKYLFQELKLDPYLTFLKIGNMIKISNLKSMQPNSVALNLYESLEDLDREKLLFLIKQDYLLKTIRPKIWWERKISRGERKTIYHEFVKAYPNLDYETLYRYSHLERYKNEYYLITYKPIQEYFLKMPI